MGEEGAWMQSVCTMQTFPRPNGPGPSRGPSRSWAARPPVRGPGPDRAGRGRRTVDPVQTRPAAEGSRWLTAPALPAPVLGLLAALLLVLLGAPSASAHAQFSGSDPAEGAQVPLLPDHVVLTYSEQVAPQFVETAVVTPDGTTVATPASVDGSQVTVDLGAADVTAAAAASAAAGGTWQVVARVVSVDGHPVEHTTTFTVAPAEQSGTSAVVGPTDVPTLAPTLAPTADPDAAATAAGATTDRAAASTGPAADSPADPAVLDTGGVPQWLLGLGSGALLLAAAVTVALQLRRRPPTG